MRKVIYSMFVSLDGFIAGPEGELDWHLIDAELHKFVNAQQSAVDTFIYGRGMYEIMAAYWPYADQDPQAPDYVVEFSRLWRDMPKIVFSKTLHQVEWNSRLVKGDIAAEIERLKTQPGKDITTGGANLAANLIRLDLIDEYQVFIHPVLIGRGKRMFPEFEGPISMQLEETRTFASGVVFLRFQRK